VRLLAAIAVVLALAAPALAASRPSEADLETKLVCPVCHETLDESNAPVAQQMKQEIRRRIAEGWTEKQILDEMVANYGPGVLSTPATHGFDLLAWVLPLGGICLGAAGLAVGAWYWSHARGGPPGPPETVSALPPDEEARLDAELARFDA
jgi:cytochrome c-type biogenesis protein CcmH